MSRRKVWESAIQGGHMVKVYRDTDSYGYSVRLYKVDPVITLVADTEESDKVAAMDTGFAMLEHAIKQAELDEATKRANLLASMTEAELLESIDILTRIHMHSAAAELVNELDRRQNRG